MPRTRDFRKTSYQFQESEELKELPRQFSTAAVWQEWRQRWITIAALIITALALIGLIWFFLFSNLFRISNVQIDGLNYFYQQKIRDIAEDLLHKKILFMLPRNNYFVFPKAELKKQVNQKVYLSNLQISTSRHTLLITGSVNATALAAVSEGIIYMVDKAGLVITQIQPSELQANVPLVQFRPDIHLRVGDSALTSGTAAFILAFGDNLKKVANLNVNDYVYDSVSKNIVRARIPEGWEIILDTTRSAFEQAVQLQDLLQQSVPDKSKLNYIDLRVAGRAFVK